MKNPAAIILTVIFVAIALISAGCQRHNVVGVSDTAAERSQRIDRGRNIGWRQFVDDWDMFWLQDEPSRLSEFPIR